MGCIKTTLFWLCAHCTGVVEGAQLACIAFMLASPSCMLFLSLMPPGNSRGHRTRPAIPHRLPCPVLHFIAHAILCSHYPTWVFGSSLTPEVSKDPASVVNLAGLFLCLVFRQSPFDSSCSTTEHNMYHILPPHSFWSFRCSSSGDNTTVVFHAFWWWVGRRV